MFVGRCRRMGICLISPTSVTMASLVALGQTVSVVGALLARPLNTPSPHVLQWHVRSLQIIWWCVIRELLRKKFDPLHACEVNVGHWNRHGSIGYL